MHNYPIGHREPARPTADPWSVVNLVMHDLSAHGVKSSFDGGRVNLGEAARLAARMLEALGVEPAVPPASDHYQEEGR